MKLIKTLIMFTTILITTSISTRTLANSNKNSIIVVKCKENEFKCKAYLENQEFDVNIGKNSIKLDRQEGDLSTPSGTFDIDNVVYYKKKKPKTKLKTIKIKENYKWCDDSESEIYNQFFILDENTKNSCKKYENMLHNDHLYDFVIPIKYNTNPTIKYKGSAIFIHIKKSENTPTAGCVAFNEKDLKFVMKNLEQRSKIVISKE